MSGPLLDEDTLVLPEAIRARLHPRRDRPPVPPAPSADAAKAWREIVDRYRDRRRRWRQIWPLAGWRIKKLLAKLDRRLVTDGTDAAPEPAEARLEAFSFLFAGWADGPLPEPAGERGMIDYWVASRGLAFAVDTLAAATDPGLDPRIWGLPPRLAGRAEKTRLGRFFTGRVGGLRRLRQHLAAAPEAAHAAAHAVAVDRRRRADLTLRCVLDYLFPEEEEWVAEDLAEGLAIPSSECPQAIHFLVYSLHRGEQLASLLRTHGLNVLVTWEGTDGLVQALDVLHGAVDAFDRLLDSSHVPRKYRRKLAEMLALVPTDEAFGALAARLADPDVIAALHLASERCPRRALRLLAPAAARRGKVGSGARVLLEPMLRRRPELADELAGTLEPAARQAVAKLLEAVVEEEAPEAPMDALPAVLRAPPWLDRRPSAKVAERDREQHGDAVAEDPAPVLEHDPLDALPRRLPAKPDFWDPAALPRPTLADGRRLPLEAVEHLGTMLSFTSPDDPYAGLEPVRRACDPGSLARFARALAERWLAAGADARAKWAFYALGLFGDDRAARELEPRIRAWPRESAHARAVMGLEILAMIGTDVSLALLHGVALAARHRGIQKAARAAIDRLARERGLSAEELADRLVPELGLGIDGELELDYGPRRFRVGFDPGLQPFVVRQDGKRLKAAPRPGKRDDAERARTAYETWKALKKDLATIGRQQVARLELAMCSRRRWRAEDFTRFLAGHPLLGHLVRRLLWGLYDPSEERLLASFRVIDRDRRVDLAGKPWTLPAEGRVGVVHRLDLADRVAARWAERWLELELEPPFPQLEREIFPPSAVERESDVLERFRDARVATGRLLALERRGWRRGAALDDGLSWWLARTWGEEVHEARIHFTPGIQIGDPLGNPEQTLEELWISRVDRPWDSHPALSLAHLPPVLFSEIVRDLETLIREDPSQEAAATARAS